MDIDIHMDIDTDLASPHRYSTNPGLEHAIFWPDQAPRVRKGGWEYVILFFCFCVCCCGLLAVQLNQSFETIWPPVERRGLTTTEAGGVVLLLYNHNKKLCFPYCLYPDSDRF